MQQYNNIKPKRGFTLIELLITIAVIGVLAAGTLVLLNPVTQIQKTNDARRKSDLEQIQRALEVYYNDMGMYPEANTSTSTNYRIKRDAATTVDWGTSGFAPYMQLLPKDPSSSKNYMYYSPAGRQSYNLYASLDRADDPQRCSVSPCANVQVGAECGVGMVCNYGVTSSNVSP